MKIIFLFFLILLSNLTFAKTISEYEIYQKITVYDMYFKNYSQKFFGEDFDWKLFKSQAIAESNLDIYAKSKEGARGIMQIMPSTFEEISEKNPYIKGSLDDARYNIAAGIFYNKELYDFWKTKEDNERIKFMLASYNAGKGNIIKAQKIALKKGRNPHKWNSISLHLKDVTGKRSKETINYLDKIKRIRQEI